MKVSKKDQEMFNTIKEHIATHADLLVDEPEFVSETGFFFNCVLPNGNPAQVQIRITRNIFEFNKYEFYPTTEEEKEAYMKGVSIPVKQIKR